MKALPERVVESSYTLSGKLILSKFSGDTEVGGVSDRAHGCPLFLRDLDRLENWAERYLIKFD